MRDLLLAVWRSATRERAYVAINLAGLALGFTCCLILGIFVYRGLTYDRHFAQHERVYRLVENFTVGGITNDLTEIPRAATRLLAADNQQIESWARFRTAAGQDGIWLRHGDLVLNWREAYYADASTFEVFPHEVLAGDPGSALAAANTIAISARLANAYFGDANPIGRLLRTDAGENWKVTLVFADLPVNTHLRYDALFSASSQDLRDAASVNELRQQLMNSVDAFTYLKMRPGFDTQDWPRISDDFVRRYMGNIGFPPDAKFRLWLQPLARTHYQPGLRNDQPTGNPAYLFGCLTVAVLILVIASINYTNLAAARALRRARSVAIRKILGARRWRLLLECLGEAVLYALVAAILGFAMAELAVTFTPIGDLLGQQVRLNLSGNPALIGIALGGAVLVGLLAGLWPAIYLSSWMPVAAFSSRGGGSASGARVREVLVMLQFVMAVGVVAAVLVMAAQMRHVANAPLGFSRENQVMVAIRGADSFARIPVVAQELRQLPQVLAVAQAGRPLGHLGGTIAAGTDEKGHWVSSQFSDTEVDAGFIPALGIPLVAGRNFSNDLRGDREIILNETMARSLGWKDVLGKPLFGGGRIVGVVRDFHFSSLRDPIGPMVFYSLRDDARGVPAARRPFVQRTLFIRITGWDFGNTMKRIEQVMRRFDPTHPFQYTLLEESLGQLYAEEQRMMRLIAVFASLCVLIACLGLFGLTAFATERRARELAIRKVLGASSWQIVALLARRVLMVIGIGGLVATAIAWVVMDEWLSGFAYRVSVNPGLMLLSIFLAAAVAFATVAIQTLKVARADPVDALRGE